MTTPAAHQSDQAPRPETPLPEREGHIIWGVPFQIDPTLIEGAEEVDGLITIYPELVSIYEDEQLLTLKLAHRLDKPIRDHITGEMINEILLGSFGQNDPVRMWFASIYTSEILASEYWPTLTNQSIAIRGEDAKPRLNEVLYDPFNAAFIANPDSTYSPQNNIHNFIRWPERLPDEILSEISRRIESNEPLNYQYLGHLISIGQIQGIENQPWAGTVLERMNNERDATRRIKNAFTDEKRQQQKYDILAEHTDVIYEFEGIDLDIMYGDSLVVDGDEIEIDGEIPALRDNFISEIPEVNLANSLIDGIIAKLGFYEYADKPTEFPIVADHIREILTRRFYDHFGLEQEMTLGQFASSVYQLRLNNTDPNLM